eukprot:scaffold44695_cov65-Phaeocystis_antarctica.AAC.2
MSCAGVYASPTRLERAESRSRHEGGVFLTLGQETVHSDGQYIILPRSIVSPPAAGRRLLLLLLRLLLLLATQPRHDRDGHRVRGVDRLQPVGAEQREAGDPEEGVEDVGLVARLVGDAAVVLVLRVQDELPQRRPVDPAVSLEQYERREHPPRVAHVRVLLRPAVEPAARRLPLAQPPAQQVALALLEGTRDRQRADAREDLARVALAPGHAAEAAVEVLARLDVVDRVGHVERVEPAEQRGTAEGAVGEPRVDLAPLVAEEGAVGLLHAGDVPQHARRLEPVERVVEHEDLHGAQRVEHVRVVPDVAAEAAALVLAAHHEVDDHAAVHVAQAVD